MMVVEMGSWRKASSGPSIVSPVAYEEGMRPGHWLGLELCDPFRSLTLMVGWQEEHPVHKKTPFH